MKKILPILLLLIAGITALYFVFGKPAVSDWKDRVYSVPDFVGLSLEGAKKKVEKTKDLVLDKVVRRKSTRTSGKVIGQKPAPGDSFEPGDNVTLYVAYLPVVEDPGPKNKDHPPILLLPELTELVREILKNKHTSNETLDFVLKGRLDPQESSRSEDTGHVYICQLTYQVYAFTSRHVRLMGPIDGSIRKWAYDKDLAKGLALKELAERIAERLMLNCQERG